MMKWGIAAFWALALSAAEPVTAQTVKLASRTFWLGENPSTITDQVPFFAPQRIKWLDAIIKGDPVLRDTVIHVEFSWSPVSETVTWVDDGDVPVDSGRLAPGFFLSDYDILGSPPRSDDPKRHPNLLNYFPKPPVTGFKVSCGVNNALVSLRVCLVLASYPPDDHIRLKARLYFPDDPAERPFYFREVVERMRDLAYCLDVTEDVNKVPSKRLKLSDCRPEDIS